MASEFEFREGLVFVEAFASTIERASFVSLTVSEISFGVDEVNFIPGAEVSFENTDTQEIVALSESDMVYLPPGTFRVSPGETWRLNIRLPDGTTYRSTPETVLAPVPISDLSAAYDAELFFREASAKFVPGHSVAVSFTDPPGAENYYYWSFRSFEHLEYCEQCGNSIFRNEGCETTDRTNFLAPYYDYKCQSDCWQIRYPEGIAIYTDRFANGLTVTALPVANIPLYTRENIVVEIQQIHLTPDAYEYYKRLDDLLDNTSGFNAPPPAALIGNMSDPDDSGAVIFGRFTAAATSTASMFIDRSEVQEEPIERRLLVSFEACEVCPPGMACPTNCSPVTTAPCSETRYRTAIAPEGWMD